MLALVENSVTESLLCSQTAHLAHRSVFDESRPGHHGGGNLFRQSPTGHGGRPLLDWRTTVVVSDRYVSLRRCEMITFMASLWEGPEVQVSDDGEQQRQVRLRMNQSVSRSPQKKGSVGES